MILVLCWGVLNGFLLSLQPAKAEVLKRTRAEIVSCPGFENVFRVSKIHGHFTPIPPIGAK